MFELAMRSGLVMGFTLAYISLVRPIVGLGALSRSESKPSRSDVDIAFTDHAFGGWRLTSRTPTTAVRPYHIMWPLASPPSSGMAIGWSFNPFLEDIFGAIFTQPYDTVLGITTPRNTLQLIAALLYAIVVVLVALLLHRLLLWQSLHGASQGQQQVKSSTDAGYGDDGGDGDGGDSGD